VQWIGVRKSSLKATAMNVQKAMALRTAPLQTPTDLKAEGVREISGALNILLSDVFALYLKTKNFHWHVSGPHFRDYHLLLDEHGDQIFGITDAIAERVRKIGGMTVRSIGEISRLQRIQDNDAEFVTPLDMLAGRCQSNAGSSACGATATSRAAIYAARARHSAKAAERLCL
jgi:starvation-inducible DNA-binding protein